MMPEAVWLAILSGLVAALGATIGLLWKGHSDRLDKLELGSAKVGQMDGQGDRIDKLEVKASDNASKVAQLEAHRDFATTGLRDVRDMLARLNDKVDEVLIAIGRRKTD